MKLAIIGAMDYEVELLIKEINQPVMTEVAGLDFYAGTIKNLDCVVVTSGIGKVNAAMCCQILISQFGVSHVLNTGVAGAIAPELKTGDVVISTDLMEHDFDLTTEGLDLGIIPRMDSSVFVADQDLIDLVLAASQQEEADYQIIKGRIVSGDVFVDDYQRKQAIYQNFQAQATEMEGAAIAHVCQLNSIPFVIVRAISDSADGSGMVDFQTFSRQSAKRSAKMVMKMIESI